MALSKYDHAWDPIHVNDTRDIRAPLNRVTVELRYHREFYGRRGWALHVQPLRNADGWATYSPMDGVHHWVMDASRASTSGRDRAIAIAENHREEAIAYLLKRSPHLQILDTVNA